MRHISTTAYVTFGACLAGVTQGQFSLKEHVYEREAILDVGERIVLHVESAIGNSFAANSQGVVGMIVPSVSITRYPMAPFPKLSVDPFAPNMSRNKLQKMRIRTSEWSFVNHSLKIGVR